MATFRTGFKIIGEITKRQGLTRIRSYSEDRKPKTWAPENQWAVRESTETTCGTYKPVKPSKSWLSIFGCSEEPKEPPPCDIRHSNCPAPVEKVEEPWYSFVSKKKKNDPPPGKSCRMERAMKECDEEPTCTEMPKEWPLKEGVPCEPPNWEPEEPKPAPTPAFILPKELDLKVWCGRPSVRTRRIAALCQSDRLPYDEFRPRFEIKKPPFSLPCKPPATPLPPCCTNPCQVPFAEFKQVEIPRPLYTRYKSVELGNSRFLLCPTEVQCQEDAGDPSLAIQPYPEKLERKESCKVKSRPCLNLDRVPRIVTSSCKPVRLKNAPKFTFRLKPTKLIERIVPKNPCAKLKSCNLSKQPEAVKKPQKSWKRDEKPTEEPSKVITSNLTDEPTVLEKFAPSTRPPAWMYRLTKPGEKETPLVPCLDEYPEEPDWCGETDGLKFYDGNDGNITPRPPKDPCRRIANDPTPDEKLPEPEECPPEKECREFIERPVLMPEKYQIRPRTCDWDEQKPEIPKDASFEEYLEAKVSRAKMAGKLYPTIKENIFYDLERWTCRTPFDPKKADTCAKAPYRYCPKPPKFFTRKFSTSTKNKNQNVISLQRRLRSSACDKKDGGGAQEFGPCKPPKPSITSKSKDCGEKPKPPDCAEIKLPCCKDGRVPPECRDVRIPRPVCKKKLPPRPSFSECSRDCPPVPKPNECNAWEERYKEDLGVKTPKPPLPKGCGSCRKYSAWAPERQFGAEQIDKSSAPQKPSPSLNKPHTEITLKTGYFKPRISPAIETFLRKPPCPSYSDVLKEKIENKLLTLTGQRSISSKINSSEFPQPLNFSTTAYLAKCGKNKKDKCSNKDKDKCKKPKPVPCEIEPFDKGPAQTWEDCPTPCIVECPIPCDVVEDQILPGCQDGCKEKPKKAPCKQKTPCKDKPKSKCDLSGWKTISSIPPGHTYVPPKSLSESNIMTLKTNEVKTGSSHASISNWSLQQGVNSAVREFYKTPKKNNPPEKKSASLMEETIPAPKKLSMRKLQTSKVNSLLQEASDKRPNITYRIDSLPAVKGTPKKFERRLSASKSLAKPKDNSKSAACAPVPPPAPELTDPPPHPEIDKNCLLTVPALLSETETTSSGGQSLENEENQELKELLGETKSHHGEDNGPAVNRSLVGSLEAWFTNIFKGHPKESGQKEPSLKEESTIHHNKIEVTPSSRPSNSLSIKDSQLKASEDAFLLSAAKKNFEKGKNIRSLSSFSASVNSVKEDGQSGKLCANDENLSAESEELGEEKLNLMSDPSDFGKMDNKTTFESLKKAIRRPIKANKNEKETANFVGANSLANLDYSKGVPFEINHSARRTEILAENFWSKYHKHSKGKEGNRCCCVRCYSTKILFTPAEPSLLNESGLWEGSFRKNYSKDCQTPDCPFPRQYPQLEKCNYPKDPPKPPQPCHPCPCEPKPKPKCPKSDCNPDNCQKAAQAPKKPENCEKPQAPKKPENCEKPKKPAPKQDGDCRSEKNAPKPGPRCE